MVKPNARDVTGWVGILSLSGGAGWVYPPAGAITLGVLLLAFAVFWRGR